MLQHSAASSCDQLEQPVEQNYPVDPNNVGYCIIINQKNFYMEQSPCLKVGIHAISSLTVFLFAEVLVSEVQNKVIIE
jgi:hypothetical protein